MAEENEDIAQSILAGKPMTAKVAYLTHMYPVYSQTFSIADVTEVRKKGVPLTVFSLKKPDQSLVTEALYSELEKTAFVRPIPILRLLGSNLSIAFRHPGVYIRTAMQCIRANSVSPVQTLKGVLHFIEAIDLGKRLIRDDFQCLHVQFADTAATYAAVIHRIFGLPFSVAVHAHDIFEHRFTGRLISFRVMDAAWIRVISKFNQRFLEDIGVDPDKIEVVRCGIDVSLLRRSSDKNGESGAMILSVGRLVPYKGHDVLIRACRKLKDSGLEATCKIIGDGPDRKALSKLIDDLDVNDNVELVGVLPHNEICRLLNDADVFALACRRADDGAMDGIPVALMEAMAMELPVVTTAISGIPELVENEYNGLIAETDDPVDLASRIRKVIEDPSFAARLGLNARKKIETEFNQVTIGAVLADRICLPAQSNR